MSGPGSKNHCVPGQNYPIAGGFSYVSEISLCHVPWRRNCSKDTLLPISRKQSTRPDMCQKVKQPGGRDLPFLSSGFFAEIFSAAASLSSHRLICSCLILKKRICFCSSLSSASSSGSMYMSDNICFSMAAGFTYARSWQ